MYSSSKIKHLSCIHHFVAVQQMNSCCGNMLLLIVTLLCFNGIAESSFRSKLLENGLARTPQMGYHYSFSTSFAFLLLADKVELGIGLGEKKTYMISLPSVFRWNSWNHFQCNIEEKLIRETGGVHANCNECMLSLFNQRCFNLIYLCNNLQLMQWYQRG